MIVVFISFSAVTRILGINLTPKTNESTFILHYILISINDQIKVLKFVLARLILGEIHHLMILQKNCTPNCTRSQAKMDNISSIYFWNYEIVNNQITSYFTISAVYRNISSCFLPTCEIQRLIFRKKKPFSLSLDVNMLLSFPCILE